MDYSKWKKILIIVSIINLLFIIYNKVFAAYDTVINNTSVTFSDNFIEMSPYFAIFTYSNGQKGYVVRSNQPITFKANSSTQYIFGGTGSFSDRHMKNYWNTSDFSGIVTYVARTDLTSVDSGSNQQQMTFNIPSGTSLVPVFSNYDLFDFDNPSNVVYNGTDINPFIYPSFDNSDEELQSLNFDKIFISLGDYTVNDPLYLKILEVTNVVQDINNPLNNIYYYNDLTFNLTNNKNFKHEFLDSNTYYYSVPYNALKLKKDKSYYFILTNNSNSIQQSIGELVENDVYFDICLCDTSNLITTEEELLNSINNNTPSENTDNTINNNLPRPSFSDENNNINIPGMNVNIPSDTTTDGFNYLFNMIYSQINPTNNVDPAQDIVFNIPFVNKELRINKDFTRNLLGYDSPIISLLSIVYYFLVSYYIIQDIRKTIESVKTGDIMTHTDTNIKADML